MKCALVTTCFNEISSVGSWIDDVLNQTLQPDQISIVDAGSTDGTREVLEAWADKDGRVVFEVWPKCNVAQGRNRAIANSDSEIIVSTDMGCRLDTKWFEKLVAPFFTESTVDVVAGNYASDGRTVISAAARAAYYINKKYIPDFNHKNYLPSSRSIAYKKFVWSKLRGYAEDLTLAGDDTVFALQLQKLRYTCLPAPDALCYWGRHSDMKGYFKEAFIYARGNGEAGIYSPRFTSPNSPQYSKLLALANSLYFSTIKSIPAILRALKALDIVPALLIVPLQFGIKMHTYRGYSVGVMRGIEKCTDCRSRLR